MYMYVVSNCYYVTHLFFGFSFAETLNFRILVNLFRPHLFFGQLKCHIWGLGLFKTTHFEFSQDWHSSHYSLPHPNVRKKTPKEAAAAPESHLWAGHKHKKSTNSIKKASPGAAISIFGRDMLLDIPSIANWKKIRDYRQHQTNNRIQSWR